MSIMRGGDRSLAAAKSNTGEKLHDERNEMKKKIMILAVGAARALGAFALAGCASGNSADSGQAAGDAAAADDVSPSGEVSVYSREDGSGTRSAFIELMGVEGKDASGEKVDMTTPAAAITNSTSVMMTSVAGDPNGIGYISLGSLNDTVKAVEVDGVEATAENAKSGTYKVARPFNIVTKDGLSDVAQDFIDFILSADGQAIVEEEGCVAVEDGASRLRPLPASPARSWSPARLRLTPVMEKLAEAYQALNPLTGVTIEVQQSDSTTGVNMAAEGTCDIGMASRELKDSESAVTGTVIAQDGIAVIVNKDSSVEGLTSDQIESIYTGEITTWEEALA